MTICLKVVDISLIQMLQVLFRGSLLTSSLKIKMSKINYAPFCIQTNWNFQNSFEECLMSKDTHTLLWRAARWENICFSFSKDDNHTQKFLSAKWNQRISGYLKITTGSELSYKTVTFVWESQVWRMRRRATHRGSCSGCYGEVGEIRGTHQDGVSISISWRVFACTLQNKKSCVHLSG